MPKFHITRYHSFILMISCYSVCFLGFVVSFCSVQMEFAPVFDGSMNWKTPVQIAVWFTRDIWRKTHLNLSHILPVVPVSSDTLTYTSHENIFSCDIWRPVLDAISCNFCTVYLVSFLVIVTTATPSAKITHLSLILWPKVSMSIPSITFQNFLMTYV